MIVRPIAFLASLALVASAGCGDDTDATAAGGGGGSGGAGTTSTATTTASTSTTTATTTTSTTTSTTTNTATSTSTGDVGGGGGGDETCQGPDLPGDTFTIHFVNQTGATVTLPQGCGAVPQVRVTLEDGSEVGIYPESANFCGFACDPIFDGQAPGQSCSDCGPGTYQQIEAGETLDYVWDRRTYAEGVAPLICTGFEVDYDCAFATELGASTYDAVVDVCLDGQPEGSCGGSGIEVPLVLDLTTGETDVVIVTE